MPAQPSQPDPADRSLGLDSFQQPADEQGLSLDQLSQAFAEMLGAGHDPYNKSAPPPPTEVAAAADDRPAWIGEPLADELDDQSEVTPRGILEALLFVGHPRREPLRADTVAAQMRGVRPAEIDELVRELNAEYEAHGCPYTIASEGSGYRMILRPEFHSLRDKLFGRTKQARLSQAAIEILAAVAYNGPLTSHDLVKLRGKSATAIVAQLVRRDLLRVERDQTEPRAPLYRTTQRFLDIFGLTSLEELPRGPAP